MKQKMNLKSGMFNGLPAYACALLLLAAGLVLSVLYAVTVGSAELSVGEVYRVILYELFRWGDPEQLGSGAVHDIVWLIRLPRVVLAVLVGMGLSVVGAVMQAIVKIRWRIRMCWVFPPAHRWALHLRSCWAQDFSVRPEWDSGRSSVRWRPHFP